MKLSSLDVKGDNTDATSIFDDEVRHEPLFVDIQVVLQRLLVQHMQDCRAGDCADEEGSGYELSAEASGTESAIVAAAEDDAHALKFDHRIASLTRHYLDRVLIGEIVAAFDRVQRVAFPVVATVGKRRVDTALGSIRVAPDWVHLRYDRHIEPLRGGLHRGAESG